VPVLDILHVGHPLLRERSRELTRDELLAPDTQAFIDDLVETMRAASGAGIAAPQVGRPVRICVIEVKDNPRYPYKPNIPLTILVNPVLRVVGEETFENFEGCLSVPNLRGVVRRACEVEVTAWDRHGVEATRTVRGLGAGTFQHEADHLDGKLFLDRVADTRTLCTWAEFERFHKEAFVARIVPFIAKWGG
jgi:peptide deformylase